MRTIDDIDQELRLLAAIRRLTGGSIERTDRLLDERIQMRAAGPLRTAHDSRSDGP